MARIRSVKPEYWADEDMSEVSRDARLLYIGLWNLSDEHGRLRGDPRYVKGQLLPYDDDLSAADVDKIIDTLGDIGKVLRYREGSAQYLFLPNLGKHQRLESEKVPSRLPAPPGMDPFESRADKSAPRADKSAPTTDEAISDGTDGTGQGKRAAQIRADKSARGADKSSLLYVAGSMEHVAGSMEHDGAAAPRADEPRTTPEPETKRGRRVPDDFAITPEMRAWYRENALDVDITLETAQFVDHWQSKSGKDAIKSDWVAAWRTWMRNAQKWKNERTPSGRRSPTGGHQPYRDDPNADYSGEL